MDDNNEIRALIQRIKSLELRHVENEREINRLKKEIKSVILSKDTSVERVEIAPSTIVKSEHDIESIENPTSIAQDSALANDEVYKEHKVRESDELPPKAKLNFTGIEKFIGENLINKIGILITILGLGIGAKYSIDNNLVSPILRIILGYVSGLILILTGFKLNKKYNHFGAVLISGGLATFYFITYFAYDIYQLIPQILAFALMVLFTVFSVFAALKLDKQAIANIGLIGAYGVPFLLSNDTGNVQFLLSYMAIINIGILFIAVKKYWRITYYLSFVLTWLIFSGILIDNMNTMSLMITSLFGTLFFIIFYVTFIANRIIRKSKFEFIDIIFILINAFVYFGLGYLYLDSEFDTIIWITAFTLFNALCHFVFALVLYKKKLADTSIFYLVAGLVLVFLTLSIPIMLDGQWVTLIWILEATLLFWIGREMKQPSFELLSYILLPIALLSLVQDWEFSYYLSEYTDIENPLSFIFNWQFMVGLIFACSLGFILKINLSKSTSFGQKYLTHAKSLNYLIPFLLVSVVYFLFRNEIYALFNNLYVASSINDENDSVLNSYQSKDYNLITLGRIWLIIFTMVYLIVLSFINMAKIKSKLAGKINMVLNSMVAFIFVSLGFMYFNDLHHDYYNTSDDSIFQPKFVYLWIRYLGYLIFALLLFQMYKYPRTEFMKTKSLRWSNLGLAFFILALLSFEIPHIFGHVLEADTTKLVVSIVWGMYSLALVGLGIKFKLKHLRIFAMVLFGITLVKLFTYDVSHLSTISKTILFICLGLLLLLISFFYNKYNYITDEE